MTWFKRFFAEGLTSGRKIEFRDLGVLVSDGEGRWKGVYEFGETLIEFFVDENDGKVDTDQADYVIFILRNFASYLESALNLITSELSISLQESRIRFRPSSLFSIIKNADESFFYMGLLDTKNEFALWRVQFENEVPTYAGFDL